MNLHRTWLDFWICVALSLFLGVLMYGCEEARASEVIVIETLLLEARGEGLEGMTAVGETIRKRAVMRNNSHSEVVLQRKQFSCWNDHVWAKEALSGVSAEEWQRAERAWELSGETNLTKGATHYHAKSVRPYWSKGHKPSAVIGNHVFYNTVK